MQNIYAQQASLMSQYIAQQISATQQVEYQKALAQAVAQQQQAELELRDRQIKQAIANVRDHTLIETMQETDRLAEKEGFHVQTWWNSFCAVSIEAYANNQSGDQES